MQPYGLIRKESAMSSFSRLSALLIVAALLVGCRERAQPISLTEAPTVQPPQGVACARDALENWLQHSSNLTQELSDLVNQNIAIQPQRANEVIDQAGSIQAALAAARPPECAAQHAAALNQALDLIEAYFSAYRQGRATDPVGSLTRINSALDEARALEAELTRLYEALPR